jgi:hypothetical protein
VVLVKTGLKLPISGVRAFGIYLALQNGWRSEMSPSMPLLNRVRGEFLEMPGLRLKVEQAQRLWNLDRASCELLLSVLVEARFLRRYSDDAYGLPSQC